MIRKILKWLLIAIIALILIFSGAIWFNTDFSNPKDLNKFVQGKIKKAGIPGISIGFIKDGKLYKTLNVGYFDVNNKKKVTSDTLFQIASVSKTLTATAVMQLHEKGLIKLDDDINKYLTFKIVHPKYRNNPITFRMLLDHTSGIDNNWDVYESLYTIESGGGDSPVSLEQFVKGFLVKGGEWYDEKKNFISSKPGEKFNYSNPGYALLGYLVEVITKTDFNEYCRKNILDPLEMNHTCWLLKETDINNLAIPYDASNKELPHYSFPTYSDGALKTNINEYSNFISCMLNDGRFKDKTILGKKTLEEMFQPQADNNHQALSWMYGIPGELFMKGMDNGKLVGHTGSDPGIFSLALFNRENKNGLIIFMNKEVKLNFKVINEYLLIKRLIKEADLT